MVEAAEALSQFVQGSVTAATEASGHEIERAGQEMVSGIAAATATMRDSLLDPMNSLVERVRGLASGVETATGRIEKYAESVENSTTAIVSANEGLGRSTETLTRRDHPRPGCGGRYRIGDPDHGRPRGNSVRSHAPDDRTYGSRHALVLARRSRRRGPRCWEPAGSLEHAVTEIQGSPRSLSRESTKASAMRSGRSNRPSDPVSTRLGHSSES